MSTKKAKPTAAPDSAPAASGRLAALRAWLRGSRGQKIAAGVVLLLLLVVSPLALLASQGAFRRQEPTVERPTLATALAALDLQEFNEARRLVEEIDRQQLTPEEQGGPEFVLAVVAAQEAEELWGQERADYYLLAARHMELARERGYQRALEPSGLLLLGRSLCLSGRVAESIPILEQALEEFPEQATEIHRLLTSAYRQGPDADLHKALEHNRQFLADPELSLSDRETGLLDDAQLLWQLDDFAACAQALDRIPADAFIRPEAELLRGQISLRQGARPRVA